MSDLRKDPITGRWVIVAENRAQRPNDFGTTPQVCLDRVCPFCEGNEAETPGEILAYRTPDSAENERGWRVRVVPNKFPALEGGSEMHSQRDGIYDQMQGIGAHEVIIETPEHLKSTSQLIEEQLFEVLWVYRDRLIELKRDARFVYAMIFKNVGAAAGASIEHTHSQLIATPIVPRTVGEELTGSLDYFRSLRRCVYCDMIRQEQAFEKRVVLDTPGYLVFCPFASRFPFETWVVPKSHSSHFESIKKPEAIALSSVLRRVIANLESVLDRPAYNYLLHTAPLDTDALGHYHWHLEIIPSLTRPAGFEWGTGCFINPIAPEQAAARLRSSAR